MRPSVDRTVEIERKYLVQGDGWRQLAHYPAVTHRQGYIGGSPTCIVRVRVVDGRRAQLTIKGVPVGTVRAEYEYEIPISHALQMLDQFALGREVEKSRHRVPVGDVTWEIDVYGGENAGLITAEIELEHEGQNYEVPSWVGAEITYDRRYANSSLASVPWRSTDFKDFADQ